MAGSEFHLMIYEKKGVLTFSVL